MKDDLEDRLVGLVDLEKDSDKTLEIIVMIY